jgi:hypothetical protein
MNGNYTTKPDKKSVITNDNGTIINSVVYTDPKFAKKIINYFSPQFANTDIFVDPCRGSGAFYKHLPKQKDWYELQEGKDYMSSQTKYNWAISNPPWRGKEYAPFANHCFEMCDNVVFLVKLFGAIGTHRRLRDAARNNMGLKEVILCTWKDANFTYIDGSEKAGEGFVLSVCHWQRGYSGGTFWTDWSK